MKIESLLKEVQDAFKKIGNSTSEIRNISILSNTLLHYYNTLANAFNLVLWANHFNKESNNGSPMQKLYEQQGISYVLFEPMPLEEK